MTAVLRLAMALLPLLLTPVLLNLVAMGRIDLGGGEKDLVWVLVWALWSVLFAVTSVVLWRRRWPVVRAVFGSAIVALGGLVLAAVALALAGQLGVGGRF